MKAAAIQQSQTRYPLIGPADPPPFEILNPDGEASVLLVCDHASHAFPRHMARLGLDPSVLDRHVAWDIGSADVTRYLSERFDAPAVLGGYSRLLVDCNRQLYDPTAFVKVSDGIAIPGNLNLSEDEKWLRVQSFYWPYHNAITEQIHQLRKREITPALISIHSCTPVFDRVVRPWHIGVLWDQDPRIAVPLIQKLEQLDSVCVGDNEPYSGRHPHDFTIDFHAESLGLPHVGIEVRQDLIANAEAARRWTGVLGDGLADILSDPDLYRSWV
ncbi:MAG: N-formylglutamate amidohydrolase [Gammaproteobacteria bacterium]|nr:N-formylglutamate amidohydrolase [Gammaproteobacteria bacterium]